MANAKIRDALSDDYVGVFVGKVKLIPRKEAEKFLSARFLDKNRVYWCAINGKLGWKREDDLDIVS